MYLSKLNCFTRKRVSKTARQGVFVQIARCICLNCKMYLSKLNCFTRKRVSKTARHLRMLMKLGLRSIFCFFMKTRKQMIFPEQRYHHHHHHHHHHHYHVCEDKDATVQVNNGNILSDLTKLVGHRCSGKKCKEFD